MVLLRMGVFLGAGALCLVGRLRRRRLAELESGAQATAARIVEEARKESDAIRKEAQSQAGDLVGRAKADSEREARDHRSELIALEKRVAQKEESIDRKIEMFAQREAELGKREDGLRQKEAALEGRRAECERLVGAVRQKLEQTAGMTPEVVVISCHNPIRRELARLTLERLVSDGRIHPGRIEEVVRKAEEELDNAIREAGQRAVLEVGVHGIHPELVKLVGMLKYRYSYAQNVLMHSIEAAFIAGAMAAELGLNEKQARRAALLHDIGKRSEEH